MPRRQGAGPRASFATLAVRFVGVAGPLLALTVAPPAGSAAAVRQRARAASATPTASPAQTASPTERVAWSTPVVAAAPTAKLTEPILLADSSGAVHLFFADDAPGPSHLTTTLRYARTAAGRWSDPVIVLAPRGGWVVYPALALDQHGWLHAVYGGSRWGRIEHRRVPLSEITDAGAWRRASILSEDAGLHSAVATGPGKMVYALYASHDHAVSFHRSEDAGRTWSAPLTLSELDPAEEACDDPRLAVDGRGRLHAAWTQFVLPGAWPPTGIYYRRSDDGGRTWLPVRRVAGEGNARIDLGLRSEEVHLAWTAVESGDRVHEWSRDGGVTWSAPRPIGDRLRGAPTRALAFALDGGGVLHGVWSAGALGEAQPIVHATWASDRATWSAAQLVSDRMEAARPVGLPAFAIGAGNRLHVAYKGDDGRIWYTEGRIDAPAVAPRPVPVPAIDLRMRLTESSPQLRVLVAVLALLGVEASVSWLRRLRRAGTP